MNSCESCVYYDGNCCCFGCDVGDFEPVPMNPDDLCDEYQSPYFEEGQQ